MLHPCAIDRTRPALTLGDTTWSYGDLERHANQLAWTLSELGLRQGDGVAVLLGNRLEVFSAFWAAMRLGLYFTPISTHLKTAEVAWILGSSRARALIASDRLAAPLQLGADCLPEHCLLVEPDASLPAPWQDLNTLAGQQPDRMPATPCEGAPLLFSSGTTGRPKGVLTSRPGAALGSVSELARRRMALHGIGPDTRYLSTAPLYHSAPLRYTEMVLRQGGHCILMDRFDPEQALALIERHRISHSQWVPTMFVRLLRLPEQTRNRHDLGSHRYAVHAAAPCPPEIKRQMIAWWGPILYEYYSATEANGQTVIDSHEWLKHPGSVGRPLLGEVRIRDEQGNDLPAGTPGLVYLSGGARFEYLDDPAKTAAAYAADGMSTLGDIGYLDDDGYLYLTDRRDFTIITGGVNVYPREVEDVLLAHPRVLDAAVLGLPDPEFGERVHAVVELSAPEDPAGSNPAPGSAAAAALATELIEYCRARLAHLKCPRGIEFTAALPRLPTGKLAKGALREQLAET